MMAAFWLWLVQGRFFVSSGYVRAGGEEGGQPVEGLGRGDHKARRRGAVGADIVRTKLVVPASTLTTRAGGEYSHD